MRRIAIVLVLIVAAGVPAVAANAPGALAVQAAPAASLRADFNNDGAADLAVGVPFEFVGPIQDAGAVNVLYGSAGGLTGTGSQLFTLDTPGAPGTPTRWTTSASPWPPADRAGRGHHAVGGDGQRLDPAAREGRLRLPLPAAGAGRAAGAPVGGT